MECNKYQDGLIYTIKTDNGLYVGSTCDFAVRKKNHKTSCFNEKSDKYNTKLYQNIRENGGEYSIELYKLFPCNTNEELRTEEEEVRKYLNANLNSQRAFMSEEEEIKYHKEYRENNREIISQKQTEIITCECGCQTTRVHISRHRKSKKHLNLMKLKNTTIKPSSV